MFKKVKVLALTVFFVLLGLRVYAASDTEVVKVCIVTAISAGTTYVSTDTIVPEQSRILGFSVNSHSTGVSQAALWDEASTTVHSETNLFGEISNPASGSDKIIFPYPKKITTQLRVSATANTEVIIYYTK